MSAVDHNYEQVIRHVQTFGEWRDNRTGISTKAVPSCMFTHDMSEGFPILAKKKISFQTSKIELVGFLNGITSKEWYQDNGCKIWDEWCNPLKIPMGLSSEDRLKAMRYQDDLGPIYGYQWRHSPDGNDQIDILINTLKNSPDSRRMIVNAWNVDDLCAMALPPCHFSWQVLVMNDTLHLNWNQRSVDVFLGLPYNICFYGTILTLLAHQFGYKPGMLTGFLGDTHIYENHLDQVEEYLNRDYPEDNNPELVINKSFECISNIQIKDIKLKGYNPHPQIKAPVAI